MRDCRREGGHREGSWRGGTGGRWKSGKVCFCVEVVVEVMQYQGGG